MTSGQAPGGRANRDRQGFVIGGNVGVSKWFKVQDSAMMDSNTQPYQISNPGAITELKLSAGTFGPPTSYDIEVYINAILVATANVTAQQQVMIVNIPVVALDLISIQAVRVVSPNASDMVLILYVQED